MLGRNTIGVNILNIFSETNRSGELQQSNRDQKSCLQKHKYLDNVAYFDDNMVTRPGIQKKDAMQQISNPHGSSQQVVTTARELEKALENNIEVISVELHEVELTSSLTMEQVEKRMKEKGYEIREPAKSLDPMGIGLRGEYGLWYKRKQQ